MVHCAVWCQGSLNIEEICSHPPSLTFSFCLLSLIYIHTLHIEKVCAARADPWKALLPQLLINYRELKQLQLLKYTINHHISCCSPDSKMCKITMQSYILLYSWLSNSSDIRIGYRKVLLMILQNNEHFSLCDAYSISPRRGWTVSRVRAELWMFMYYTVIPAI